MTTNGNPTSLKSASPVDATATGRLTVRDRLAELVDPGTFAELAGLARHRTTAFGMADRRPAGDAVVTGLGTVDGRTVTVFAQDPSELGGSLGEVHAAKIERMLHWADRARTPVVGLLDSGGARIQEGVRALDGYGRIFRANVALSGRVPQLSLVLGSCAGGAVYSPALTDIVVMTQGSAKMFLTGPSVVKAVTSEDVTAETLGGAAIHARQSGVVHLVGDDDSASVALARRVLTYLPSSAWAALPTAPAVRPDPLPSVPTDPRKTYDVRGVIRGIADSGSFLELQERFASNMVIGFGRIDGLPVGFTANQPNSLAGVLNIDSAEKAARFVRLCDAFGLPLVTLVDTPGFLPGTAQESGGVIRKGAKLLYAFAEATVPRITVVLRKAFGGAYIAMNSKALGADAVFAWSGAQLAVMGAEGAVDVIYRRALAADPASRPDLISNYLNDAMATELAAEAMSVDEIISPARTRDVVAATLRSLHGALRPRFRHDNLPQ